MRKRCPLAAHTRASDAPVLPPVYSTTVPPVRNRPFPSARSITARVNRFFMPPVGFFHSSFTQISPHSSDTIFRRGTSHALPMNSSTIIPILLRRSSPPRRDGPLKTPRQTNARAPQGRDQLSLVSTAPAFHDG